MYKLFMPIAIDRDDWSWASDSTLWVGTDHAAGYYQYIWSEVSIYLLYLHLLTNAM